jgi:antitoxin component YwqK of YwqJK toxin-antitoxin module
MTGVWKYYHKNGQLSGIEKYKKGECKKVKYYDINGNLE